MDASPSIVPTDGHPVLTGPCVTSAAGLWRWLGSLTDGQQLTLAVCIEACRCTRACTRDGRRRRAPTEERTIVARRSGGRVRLFDGSRPQAPPVEVTGAHDLTRYFDAALGFVYVQVRAAG